MSKERLEGFREFIDFMYESVDIEDHQRFIAISETMIKDGWFKWIYRYAKEQAERVQELEEKHKEYVSFTESNNHNMDIEFEKIYKRNKQYRERLEYMLAEAKDHKEKGLRVQHRALIKDLEKALEGEE